MVLATAAFAALAMDQAAKRRVLLAMRPGMRFGGKAFHSQRSRAWGPILRAPAPVSVVVWIVAAGMALWLVHAMHLPNLALICMGVALGGAASNLLDRFLHGRVIDFIVVFDRAFNPADIAIVAGIVGVVLTMV